MQLVQMYQSIFYTATTCPRIKSTDCEFVLFRVLKIAINILIVQRHSFLLHQWPGFL